MCPDLICREIKVGEIHICCFIYFCYFVSLSREIDVCVEQDLRWTKVKGMEPYDLLSDVLSILIELLFNVHTAVIKLFVVLACIVTTCIELSIKILVASVIYVTQFSSAVVQKLVQELQDLFALVEAILIMIQQMIASHYCSKGYSSLCRHS